MALITYDWKPCEACDGRGFCVPVEQVGVDTFKERSPMKCAECAGEGQTATKARVYMHVEVELDLTIDPKASLGEGPVEHMALAKYALTAGAPYFTDGMATVKITEPQEKENALNENLG